MSGRNTRRADVKLPWWGRCVDVAQLAFGVGVLPPFFRLLDTLAPTLMQHANHEATANRGRSFIEEASTLQKALFVLKMLGTYGGHTRGRRAAVPGARKTTPTQARDTDVVAEVIFLGDMLYVSDLGDSSLSQGLRERLCAADHLVVNLEGTVGSTGSELYPFQSLRGLRQLFDWNRSAAAGDWVARFAEQGLSDFAAALPALTFTLAGNHSLDEGTEGLANTLASLTRLGTQHIGHNSKDGASAVVSVAGFSLGVLTMGFGQNQPSQHDCGVKFTAVPYTLPSESIARHMRHLREQGAEVLVASLHWGYEHERWPREDQRRCIEQLWDMGFSHVVGHHPHIVQGGAQRDECSAWFSLGDFVGGDRTVFNRLGYAVALQRLGDGRWRSKPIPLVQTPYYAPRQQTALLDEAASLERTVWRRLFSASVGTSVGTTA